MYLYFCGSLVDRVESWRYASFFRLEWLADANQAAHTARTRIREVQQLIALVLVQIDGVGKFQVVHHFAGRRMLANRCAASCRILVRDVFVQAGEVLLENADPIGVRFLEAQRQRILHAHILAHVPRMECFEFDDFFRWILVYLRIGYGLNDDVQRLNRSGFAELTLIVKSLVTGLWSLIVNDG